MTRLIAPLRLRSMAVRPDAKKVTWLELFFDLVFVAAVAQVAEPLREHYTLDGLVRFVILFALIWWAWAGYALFATRFDANSGIQRALTVLQMFVVAAMAANAGDELDSRSSAGFAAAYAALRLVLVAQYLRARHLIEARPLTTRYIVGHGIAAIIWLASVAVPTPLRFWMWAVAFVIDLGTPWAALPHSATVPPDAEHLPERFGLFTLILLGEAVVGVMHGMKSQEDWAPAAAASALLGMAIVFLMWWWYFEGADAAAERTIRTRGDALRFHIWSYAHFPLYLGVVVVGVGVQSIVTAAARSTLGVGDSLVITGAAVLMTIAMATIGVSTRPHAASRILTRSLGIAAVAALLGVVAQPTSPVVVVLALAVFCGVQAAVALDRPSAGDARKTSQTNELMGLNT